MMSVEETPDATESYLNVELEDAGSPLPYLSDEEINFIEAVRENNKDQVQAIICDWGQVDVNCMDSSGQTALQIAVKSGFLEIVSFLLEKGADEGNALLDAITEDSLECVKLLVPYDKLQNTTQNTVLRRSVSTQRHPSVVEEPYRQFLTPLMFAAQKGSYEITKFLMAQGYVVADPHPKFCGCTECVIQGRLGTYLSHLNTYRAFVSPVYMALSFLYQQRNSITTREYDPIYRALVLKKELVELADVEYEFRDEYLELSRQCESFAVALLDQCRDFHEISHVMDLPGLRGIEGVEVRSELGSTKKLSILNFAMKYRNTKFIAHRYSQVMLNSVLYRGLYGWEENNFIVNGCLVGLYWLLMPLVMILCHFTPGSCITRTLETPLVKFISHTGSMLWFLVLLTLASFQDKLDTALRISTIGLWVIGILVEEIKQAKRQGKERYLAQWWHLVTLVVVLLFITAAVLWSAAYIILLKKQESWTVPLKLVLQGSSLTPHNMMLLSNSFYAVALVLTFFQASHSFQVNYLLGPLHLSMMIMVGDVTKFLVLFSLNYLAFCIGIRKLYSQYVQTRIAFAMETNGTLSLNHKFERPEGSFRYLFWALFGKTSPAIFQTDANFEITQVTGEIMFAAFSVTAILVALNVLIAMLSNTYQKVDDDKDITFKVVRTRIWMQYINEGSMYPPPFNLFPVKAIISFFYGLCTTCARKRDMVAVRRRNQRNFKRQEIIKLLIQRYFIRNEEWTS